MSRQRISNIGVAVSVTGLLCVAVACGADNVQAPAAELSNPDLAQCKGFEQIMPNFVRALQTGRTQNLRTVIECSLVNNQADGSAPPIADVLRSIFTTLAKFARESPEPGAPSKQLCAPDGSPPPLAQSNQLCEMRRALFTLVHQGKGISAIALIDPAVSGLVNYIIGASNQRTLPDGGVVGNSVVVQPHYEIATVVGGMCSQDGQCRLENGLDLIIAFTAYLETTEGKKLLTDAQTLIAKPQVQALLDSSAGGLGEEDMVNLVKILGPALQNADPAQLQSIADLPFLSSFKADLQPLIDDLKVLLDPNHQPDIRNPLRKVVTCFSAKDKNYDLVRMIHRLAIQDRLPEFGVTQLLATVGDIQSIDPRGGLVHLIGVLASAVRADEQAIDSAAKVCKALFSTRPTGGQVRSNAELALPVVADLFNQGVANEAVCAIDVLVWGCAGGTSPACPGGTQSPMGYQQPVTVPSTMTAPVCQQ